jgi:PAS domain S-box-containing protein
MPSAPVAPPVEQIVGLSRADQQRFWQSVVDTIQEGLLLVSPDQRILYMNRRAEELAGVRLDAVVGTRCTDGICCPQCECRCRLFDEGAVDGIRVTIFDARTGAARTLRKNARLLRDDEGHVVCGVETFQDISAELVERADARHHFELLCAERDEKEALLSALPDGVCTIDARGKVLRVSTRMSALLGVAPALVEGQDLFELLEVDRPIDLDGARRRVTLRSDDGGAASAELVLRAVAHRDGELVAVLRVLGAQSEPGPQKRTGFHGIVSRSPAMEATFELVESAAASPAPVLVEGESGTGKELVARAIHGLSARRDEPFHAVNCATFQGSLLLSELFGHERGAFTGAYRTTKGKLELAGAGTLFLDEVSQIPLHYQGVLLRVLEERSFERVGGAQPIPLRARIVSATNDRLADCVRAGRFREDLYYRLRVVPIAVPPLRDRPGDVDVLIDYFASHPAVNLRGKPLCFTDSARDAMRAHDWPGNVRELRNLVEYLCCLPDERIEPRHLPVELRAAGTPVRAKATTGSSCCDRARDGGGALADIQDERERILTALRRAGGKRADAARALGMERTTLWRRMARFGIVGR